MSPALIGIVLPALLGILTGEWLAPSGWWTPLRELGAWRNARVAAKSLRLLNACSSCADVCIAFSGLYLAARRRR